MRFALSAAAIVSLALPNLALAQVSVLSASGDVQVRAPKTKSYSALSVGVEVAHGARVKTGANGKATLKFPDGTQAKVHPKSEIVVRAKKTSGAAPNAVVLFFGRVWSKVVKATGGAASYEVRSANAVAGVRGTEFEVGVADNGAARVVVSEGKVAVGGEAGAPVNISGGFEIEADHAGRLQDRRRAPRNRNWSTWFSKRALALERQGLRVARNLNGRLDRRRAKLIKLVKEQRQLRKQIIRLERKKRAGQNVDGQLRSKLARLEKVTARLVDMQTRLQAAFGIFERWDRIAKRGAMGDAKQMGKMCESVRKIAADFADMIEEGTDLSEDGMNDMMNDMEKGNTLKPKKSAADELF